MPRKAKVTTPKAKGRARTPKRKATKPRAFDVGKKAEAKKAKAEAKTKKAKAKKQNRKANAKPKPGPKPRPVSGSPSGRTYSSNMPYHFSADVAQRGLNLASDCSGWCVEGLAAEQVSDEHINQVFASDVNAAVRTS